MVSFQLSVESLAATGTGARENCGMGSKSRTTNHEFSQRSGDPPVAERTTNKPNGQTKLAPRSLWKEDDM